MMMMMMWWSLLSYKLDVDFVWHVPRLFYFWFPSSLILLFCVWHLLPLFLFVWSKCAAWSNFLFCFFCFRFCLFVCFFFIILFIKSYTHTCIPRLRIPFPPWWCIWYVGWVVPPLPVSCVEFPLDPPSVVLVCSPGPCYCCYYLLRNRNPRQFPWVWVWLVRKWAELMMMRMIPVLFYCLYYAVALVERLVWVVLVWVGSAVEVPLVWLWGRHSPCLFPQ